MNECQIGTAYSLIRAMIRSYFVVHSQYETCVSHLLGYQQMPVNENTQ